MILLLSSKKKAKIRERIFTRTLSTFRFKWRAGSDGKQEYNIVHQRSLGNNFHFNAIRIFIAKLVKSINNVSFVTISFPCSLVSIHLS